MLVDLFSPFMKATTPEEVKQTLKDEAKLSEATYRALFRKGIMNNFSPGMKAVMLPRKEPLMAKTLRRGGSVDSRRPAPKVEINFSKEDRLENLRNSSL